MKLSIFDGTGHRIMGFDLVEDAVPEVNKHLKNGFLALDRTTGKQVTSAAALTRESDVVMHPAAMLG